jgi:ATP phosphoribosyltransferase regulatory subunit
MADAAAERAEAERLLAAFLARGALRVEADILQPAETLLDLYGEDIRARAYVTADPLRGEMMLRPDFTLPVVQMHMAGGAEPARYAYMGPVFRQQEHRGGRPRNTFRSASSCLRARRRERLMPRSLRPSRSCWRRSARSPSPATSAF